ncbi:MAG: hypothetical protein GY737_18420 [Desulfobacteraceae bacterium]|nr:hypothetical protein [Desulfobacteraceae bacterium]
MIPMMKTVRTYFVAYVVLILLFPGVSFSEPSDYERTRMSFTNFVRCELTRTNANNYFNGKSFEITMINLYGVRQEGDIQVVTGAVDCFVEKKHELLYVAAGVTSLIGHEKVSYFVVRKHDFSILATELMKYPYKERCAWSQYWIDID